MRAITQWCRTYEGACAEMVAVTDEETRNSDRLVLEKCHAFRRKTYRWSLKAASTEVEDD